MKKNSLIVSLILFSLVLSSCSSSKINEQSGGGLENSKNYLGWIDTTSKDIVYKDGIISLRVKQNLGSFNISVINQDNKIIPTLLVS